jgi:predicted DNA-binding protein with PD1-like motif
MRLRRGLKARPGGLFVLAVLVACAPLRARGQSSTAAPEQPQQQSGQPQSTRHKSSQPESTKSQYIPPGDLHVKSGGAPAMKVRLIGSDGSVREYVVIFSRGDEALSGLTDFAQQYHVSAAHFTAIGALEGATLAWFDPPRKAYKLLPVPGQTEVASMVGDIALYHGKPVVHTHAVLGRDDGSARAGHVIEAHVSPTLEVFVTTDAADLHKKLDELTGLLLIDPTAKE